MRWSEHQHFVTVFRRTPLCCSLSSMAAMTAVTTMTAVATMAKAVHRRHVTGFDGAACKAGRQRKDAKEPDHP